MNCAIRFDGVSVHYGPKPAIREITLAIPEKQIFGIIGPASSGKTTLLKCINRTLEFTSARAHERQGRRWPGADVSAFRNVYELRRRVGMVFPLPVGLPLSIYENVAYAPAGPACTTAANWTPWWSDVSGRRCSGTRSATVWTCWARGFPAGSSSG